MAIRDHASGVTGLTDGPSMLVGDDVRQQEEKVSYRDIFASKNHVIIYIKQCVPWQIHPPHPLSVDYILPLLQPTHLVHPDTKKNCKFSQRW